jgi:hypothetical protein
MRDRTDSGPIEAAKQYAVAYAAHYTTKDLRDALELYMGIMAGHPDTQEAGYSRSQIQNIANAVVPRQELVNAQVDLVLAHLGHEDQAEVTRAQVTPLALQLTS